MLRVFVLLCLIKNNPTKIIKCIVKHSAFLLLLGFKTQMKMSFMVLEIYLFDFGKVLEKRGFSKWQWKSFGFLFGKILKIF